MPTPEPDMPMHLRHDSNRTEDDTAAVADAAREIDRLKDRAARDPRGAAIGPEDTRVSSRSPDPNL